MKRILLTAILSCYVFTVSIAQSVNTEKSTVIFTISNMALNTVKGTFSGMKGIAKFIPENLSASSFDVCIIASSINTNNEKRDKHLRTADFFDTDKYPVICFKSKNISKTGKGYMATGTLSLHGVVKEVQIPFNFSGDTLRGIITLNRLDYKIGPASRFMVGNDVEIEIICVLEQ